jgi:acyl-[acyl-carrier-protein]-phospholipid O-acyltransferase / long-chain-fatty-acid--[acyl-carrier-protein] ligase
MHRKGGAPGAWPASNRLMRQIIPQINRWFLPALVVRFVLWTIAWLMYRVSVGGQQNVPREGGVLLISNHLSYVDVALLQMACPRYIHYVASEDLFEDWWLRWLLRMMDVVPISRRNPRSAIRQVVERLQAGAVVCLFPEGQISRTGNLQRIMPGFEFMARRAGCPVLPAMVDGIWGSVFSFAGDRYWGSGPLAPRHPVQVEFGETLDTGPGLKERCRTTLLDLGAAAFARRRTLQGNVAYRALCSLASRPWKTQLIDTFPARRELSRGKLLGASLAYSRVVRRQFPEKRVGIALPPGAGGAIANLAVALAGKTPANINFTADKAATEASYRNGEIRGVITAEALEKKLPADFVWPEEKVDLPSALKGMSKATILGWVALAYLLPGPLLAAIAGVSRKGGATEAGLLFTSGSSGEPKGVVLTHQNILANIEQISGVNFLRPTDSFLASLPLFHSFGFTVTFWLPLIRGIRVVAVPSPLDPRKIAEAVSAENVTGVFGTPTFLRPYLKKIQKEEFASVRIVVAGAEKLPGDLREEFERKFGTPVIEGYGLTETSPVVSANLPDPRAARDGRKQAGGKVGSVGRLLPGLTARIVGEEGMEMRSLFERGVLLLKGASVFPGYLNDEKKTEGAFVDGWFITGDLVRFDEEGFLYIEGRVSRFSKIGGEMVPHGTVEERIREVMQLDNQEPAVVVMGIRGSRDWEHLVALSSVPLDQMEMRKRLREAGLPNLWIPRVVLQVEKIPVLGSGKLDLKSCQSLVEELVQEQGGDPGGEEEPLPG